MKTLRELGEDAIVDGLVRLLPPQANSVQTGPGDDCAVIREPGSKRLKLLKTDVVVEGIHFLAEEKMSRVGWKALSRAVSDIAAMGGTPEFALITLLAPPETAWERVKELYRGISRAARRFGVSVVGGETGRTTGPLVCNVALTGWAAPERCVLRSGGRAGDVLFVTGRLGGSFQSGKHLDFTPRLKEAAWLVEHFLPSAMMDLSDGLATDGRRLAEASGCELQLDITRIPRTRGCSVEQALGDGEDFELLFAIAPDKVPRLLKAWSKVFPRLLLSEVGVLLDPKSARKKPDPSAQTLKIRGYDHFQES
ncbi:MAG: thiamine-phosphate kinase [Verrucomicrobiota bacterium]